MLLTYQPSTPTQRWLPTEPPNPPTPRYCRNAVEKKTVLENLDLVLLAMDEIVEGG